MKRTIIIETDDISSSTETESLIESTPSRMSDPDQESEDTSQEVAWQVRSVTDPPHAAFSPALRIDGWDEERASQQKSRKNHLI